MSHPTRRPQAGRPQAGRNETRKQSGLTLIQLLVAVAGKRTRCPFPRISMALPLFISVALPLLTLLLSLVTAQKAVAQVSGADRFGISDGYQIPYLSAVDRGRRLDGYRNVGSKWIRFDIDWGVVQPFNETSYDWTKPDNVIRDAQARGLKILGVIAYTPPWARPGGTTDKYPPTNLSKYANFAAAVARRYTSWGVRNWEIWNEPNIEVFWKPRPDPARYTQMLQQAYNAIKNVDPGAVVISAGLSPAGDANNLGSNGLGGTNVNPIIFVQEMYARGARGYFDALGFHPYSFPYAPSTATTWNAWQQMAWQNRAQMPAAPALPSLRDLMVSNGDGAKKIWMTEYGAPVSGNANAVSESVQAQHLTEAYNLAGSYSWAGPLFWYNYQGGNDGTGDFGLVRSDYTNRPSYFAYQNAALAAATLRGYYKLIARHSGKALDVAGWSTANGAYVQQFDYAGNANQQWWIESVGGGYYKILCRWSGKALDVAGWSTADGAYVQQFDYAGNANQQWWIESVGGGYYKILCRWSGKALNVSGASQLNGAAVIQWPFNQNELNSQWWIELVP